MQEETDAAIDASFNILRSRIDHFGVTQPNIQRLPNSHRILVELPGVKEPERVRKLLQGTASLEFWTTYNNTELVRALEQADQLCATNWLPGRPMRPWRKRLLRSSRLLPVPKIRPKA